jgi:hypothetical protein
MVLKQYVPDWARARPVYTPQAFRRLLVSIGSAYYPKMQPNAQSGYAEAITNDYQ